MVNISEKIQKLPKKSLRRWISDREKEKRSEDWKDELAKLKKRLDDSGTGKKGKGD